MPEGSQKVKAREIKRNDQRVFHQLSKYTAEGAKIAQFMQFYVDGKMVAVLEDSDFDGAPNGLTLFDASSDKFEYFYFEENLKVIPASTDEMKALNDTAAEVEGLLTSALEGDNISNFEIYFLRGEIWLRKWDFLMLFTLALCAFVGFLLGKRTKPKQAAE